MSFGDKHSGLRNGLKNPDTVLTYNVGTDQQEEAVSEFSDWSKWLWFDVWLPACEFAVQWAGDDSIVLSDDGDICHGSRHASNENLYSAHSHHQRQIVVDTYQPLSKIKNISALLLAFGTQAHDYGVNGVTIQVAEELIKTYGWNVIANYQIRYITENGFEISVSHHGASVGKQEHLRNNGAIAYGKGKIRDAVDFGEKPAGLYQSGHFHNYSSAPVLRSIGDIDYKTHVIVTPAMTGPNPFARMAARSADFTTCGVYFWEEIDGKIGDVIPFFRRKDNRTLHRMPKRTEPEQVEKKRKKLLGIF